MNVDTNHPHIAIVDDDPGFASALGHFLQDRGYPVRIYGTGKDALVPITRSRPLLAVIDAHLPDMHGVELIDRLHDTDVSVPVLMVTGDTTVANLKRCHGAGIHGVMIKPVNPDEFCTAVLCILDSQSGDH